MSRRPALTPSVKLTTMIPADIHAQLSLLLWSDLEGKVPIGAWQRWICERAQEYMTQKHLDLSPFCGEPAGAFIVRGNAFAISLLEELLKGNQSV